MKKLVKNPLTILAVAVVLVLGSSVGATRAAVVYQTAADMVSFETATLSVGLYENGKAVGTFVSANDNQSSTSPLTLGLAEGEKFAIGKLYSDNVTVKNISGGQYDEYVRVIIRKSWMNADGTKDCALDPSLIVLTMADGFEGNWIEETASSTEEQKVYYLKKPLAYNAEASVIKSVQVLDEVTEKITKTGNDSVITTTYDYAGKSFSVDVEVDAVQTHSAKEAIRGAWGVDATIVDGQITGIQ